MSRRCARLGSLIREILAEAIRDRLSDPRIPMLTSITRVDVSDDLSVARVHVSVMDNESQRKLCITALQKAAGRLRRLLAPELHLRKLPSLVFLLDESMRKGFETLTVIDHAMRELGEVPEWERETVAAEADTEVDEATGVENTADRTATPAEKSSPSRGPAVPDEDA